jgi:hypothetical protein
MYIYWVLELCQGHASSKLHYFEIFGVLPGNYHVIRFNLIKNAEILTDHTGCRTRYQYPKILFIYVLHGNRSVMTDERTDTWMDAYISPQTHAHISNTHTQTSTHLLFLSNAHMHERECIHRHAHISNTHTHRQAHIYSFSQMHTCMSVSAYTGMRTCTDTTHLTK